MTRHKGQGQNPQGRDADVAAIGCAAFGAGGGVIGRMMYKAEDFVGTWALERTIHDHLYSQHGTLQGGAVFTTTEPLRLTYEETGTLTLEHGAKLEATRRYHWTFAPDAVAVLFEDGRPFHAFVPSGHAAGTDHPCGADLYKVRYDFTQWPQWTAVWSVIGPRKDYVSTSTYRPR